MLNKLEKIKGLFLNSPLVKIGAEYNGKKKFVYAKCEWYSLTGSVKDRVAYQIFLDAIKNGKINSKTKVCEVTSGNMGISICAISNILGLDCTIILPKNMSEERKKLLKAYGANLVLVDDFKSAFTLCKEFENKGYFCPHQFENKSNFNCHYNLTAPEIYEKIKNKGVKNFVCGVGTSGTLSGVGTFLKEKGLSVTALEPFNSRILTNKKPFLKHSLQGLADEIVPKLYQNIVPDKIVQIKDEDAIFMAQKLCIELSLGVGISSGANFLASILSEENSVTIFADDNKKYLSTNLTQPCKSQYENKIKLTDIEFV